MERRYNGEEVEVLMLVAWPDEGTPLEAAMQVRERWATIRRWAGQIRAGEQSDCDLPYIWEDPVGWEARAEGVVSVLDEFIREQENKPAA